MTYYGCMKELHPEEESTELYIECVELFFTANEAADGKKVTVFLSIIGSKTCEIIRSLVAPAKPLQLVMRVTSYSRTKEFHPEEESTESCRAFLYS